MTKPRTCATCGAALPAGALKGQCPQCLLQFGLDASANDGAGTTAQPGVPLLRYFGDYELLEEIARSGMGVVYKARQVSLNRVVAVKMILAGPFAGKESLQRFRAEAEAAASLRHPNIVAIHEIGEHEGQPYFSMDYIQGHHLAEAVREHPMPARRAAACIQTIAQAIQFAHDRGVLHRDLKPSNVLLDIFDAPHITDFGLAKRLSNSKLETRNPELTMTGQVLGSPNYMPPEQASGKRATVGPASDVYSLGAILHHLLTGRAPFATESVTDTLQQVLHNEPVSPRLLNPAVPLDLETICLKCLQKEPARRYAKASQLAEELERFLRGEPILARPIGSVGQAWRWCRRKPALATVGGLAVMLLLVVAIGAPIAVYRINNARIAEKNEGEKTQKEFKRAEASAKSLRRSLYLADMTAAQLALQENNLGHAVELVTKYFPKNGEDDLRGVEWRYLWDLCQGDESFTLDFQGYPVMAVAFSPNGQLLACAAGHQVIIVEITTKRILARLPGLPTRLHYEALAFSSDGALLASIGDQRVNVWRTGDWQFNGSLGDDSTGPFSANASLVGAPFGRTLATADAGKVSFWNWDTRELIRSIPMTAAGLSGPGWLVYSQDGNRMAIGDGNRIRILEATTGRWDERFDGELIDMRCLGWSSHWIVAGSWQGDVKIWDTRNGQEVLTTKAHPKFTFALAVAPNGRTLATGGGDQEIHLWDLDSLDAELMRRGASPRSDSLRKVASLRGHHHEVWALAFSPDGRMLASGSKDGTTKLWMLGTKRPDSTLPGTQTPLQFSTTGPNLLTYDSDGALSWWNISSRQRIERIDLSLKTNAVTAIDISSDAKVVAVGMTNGTVRVWDLDTRRPIATEKLSDDGIAVVNVSPQGNLIAAETTTSLGQPQETSVFLWNRVTGTQRRFPHAVFPFAFSPDEKILAMGASDYSIRLWDLAASKELPKLEGHKWKVTSLAFSQNGKFLFSTSWDNTLVAWETTSWKGDEFRERTGVTAAAPSANGLIVATASADQAIRLWEVQTRRVLLTLPRPLPPKLMGDRIAMSADGSALALEQTEGSGEVLLLRAPAFAEIDARHKSKAIAELTVFGDN